MSKKSTSKKSAAPIAAEEPAKASAAPVIAPDPTDAISEKADHPAPSTEDTHAPPVAPPSSPIADTAPIQSTPPARSWTCSCGSVNPFDRTRNAQVCPVCGFDYPNSILSQN